MSQSVTVSGVEQSEQSSEVQRAIACSLSSALGVGAWQDGEPDASVDRRVLGDVALYRVVRREGGFVRNILKMRNILIYIA